MTAAAPVRINAKRRPVQIIVPRASLVGAFMDADSLAAEAMYANGAAIQLLQRVSRDAAVEQAIVAAHDTHDRLKALRRGLQASSGRYDKPEGA